MSRRSKARRHARRRALARPGGNLFEICERCHGMSNGGAQVCQHCGTPIGSRVVVAASMHPTDAELARMDYVECLRWAANDDGLLTRRARLQHIAKARHYDRWWLKRVLDRHWRDVVQGATDWRQRRAAEREQPMTVVERDIDVFVVMSGTTQVAGPFASNAGAWDWIDNHSDAGRADIDRHRRIRHAFSER